MLKITMPIYTATFPQDFLKVIFLAGETMAPPGPPLRIAYVEYLSVTCNW